MIGSEVTRQCVIVPSAGHHEPHLRDDDDELQYEHQPEHHQQYDGVLHHQFHHHALCASGAGTDGHQATINDGHHHDEDEHRLQQHLDDGWAGCDFGDADCVASGGECNCCDGQFEDAVEAVDYRELDGYQRRGDDDGGAVVGVYDLGMDLENEGSATINEYMVVVGETYDCPQDELLP